MNQDLPYLEHPSCGIPEVINTPDRLNQLFEKLRSSSGPIGFDVERAHGYRYWQKAYLFQLCRADIGTHLIDPIAFEQAGRSDLSGLTACAPEAEWIIHSASQDLPSMVTDAIIPVKIFDTELAARLLDYPVVSLAGLVERHFGVRLRKAHSAVNWATRPLPDSWLSYAALDVEHLLELRELLAKELVSAGKLEWAEQEFAHQLTIAKRPVIVDPERWRRLKGLREITRQRGLAIARALWTERDRICQASDRPPTLLLPDQAIVALAKAASSSGPLPDTTALSKIREFNHRGARRYTPNWLRAINSVGKLSASDYPEMRKSRTSIGQPKSWARRNPQAMERWLETKPEIDALAEKLGLASSLLIQPLALRTLIYSPSEDLDAQLAKLEVRPWQVELVKPVLYQTLYKN